MEFLPIEKNPVGKKREGQKRKIGDRLGNTTKKSRREKVKKLITSGNEEENKCANEPSQQTEEVSPCTTDEKAPIYRLFVNMKKIIMNEQEVKDIHPFVVSVRFPRKKRTKWCWAVFRSQEQAAEALVELGKRKDIIVSEPLTESKKNCRKIGKTTVGISKKSIRSKIREAWL